MEKRTVCLVRIPTRGLLVLLAVLGTFAPAFGAAAEGSVVRYDVDRKTLKKELTFGDALTFELYRDSECLTTPVISEILGAGTEAVAIEEIKALAVKRQKPKPTRRARLRATLNVPPFEDPIYLKVRGSGIAPIGGECQLQMASAGSEGPQGAQGEPGPVGPIGAKGSPGPQGSAGPGGAPGLQGPRGPSGSQGVAGPAGPLGAAGPEGLMGPEGPMGPQGTPGVSFGSALTPLVHGALSLRVSCGGASVVGTDTAEAACADGSTATAQIKGDGVFVSRTGSGPLSVSAGLTVQMPSNSALVPVLAYARGGFEETPSSFQFQQTTSEWFNGSVWGEVPLGGIRFIQSATSGRCITVLAAESVTQSRADEGGACLTMAYRPAIGGDVLQMLVSYQGTDLFEVQFVGR